MKIETLHNIILSGRQSGSSTWIVKSAIKNPDVVIVAKNDKCRDEIKFIYNTLLNKSNFILKIKWKIFGRKHPKILSINQNFRKFGLPIVFDNSVFY